MLLTFCQCVVSDLKAKTKTINILYSSGSNIHYALKNKFHDVLCQSSSEGNLIFDVYSFKLLDPKFRHSLFCCDPLNLKQLRPVVNFTATKGPTTLEVFF